jgi:D-arabinose 1-dehydrogenase-like Zn-dependent alcohol dehydrogenase
MAATSKKTRVVQIDAAKGPFTLAEREIPEPEAGSVRVQCRPAVFCHDNSHQRAAFWTAMDSADTLRFSASHGVRSHNEIFPLERAAEAYDRTMSGKARVRHGASD